MKTNLPQFNKKYFCIINRDSTTLAALISSYTFEKKLYTLFFEYASVTSEYDKAHIEENVDIHQISRIRATEFCIKIENTLKRIGGCEYLIIAGLDENQKTYLTFLKDYNVIEISDENNVDVFLNGISNKNNIIKCQKEDIHRGLYYALKTNSALVIDSEADFFSDDVEKKEGLIVIENIDKVSTIIAINYASTFELNISIISPLQTDKRGIKNLIEDWQAGNINSYNDLSALLYGKLEDISFDEYSFATFFTIGAPYSLILKNIIPFTHVHLYLNPDFFIFNNLYFENSILNSAIVFSPLMFKDEETNFVIEKLQKSNYYIKELVGKNASAHNIDIHVKVFPFNLIHFCSHGGEVSGSSIKEEYIDRNKNKHIVEYDVVMSFSPQKGKELIKVTRKLIWRKFDGLIWGSKEFKTAKYPNYIFPEMINTITNKKDKKNKIVTRKDVIADSCSIKCSDFIYQAMFNILASQQSPLIFNNTCWSWSDIADSFIAVGAKGYIGTLWSVNNQIAKDTAEIFYENLFKETILSAFYKALKKSKDTKDDNIYIYWGLHFSTIKKGFSNNVSKMIVTQNLIQSLNRWKDKLENTQNPTLIKNIEEIIDWNASQLATVFKTETIKLIDYK